ncbi:CUB and sushi domain-containing protein 3 [Platysternon megacephalum]|uniref:CUB and sushi domain-containing protein 3 n=1 Tax=Platysternon megacephalum TaxID=55544 RepID=A0A4D9EZW0_9SAUR|nr:CUB and sushi domain-containing protein 3 [Platysternon megacephalum]
MSAKSKGTPASSSPPEGPPAASKAKVKEQIKIIVEDLELVLGDLKDVAKELKEAPLGFEEMVWARGTIDASTVHMISTVAA